MILISSQKIKKKIFAREKPMDRNNIDSIVYNYREIKSFRQPFFYSFKLSSMGGFLDAIKH